MIKLSEGLWTSDQSEAYTEQGSQLLLQGVSSADSTVSVRYYELSLMVATISEQSFILMASGAINQVLHSFFEKDALTQLALMDFFVEFEKMPWTGKLTAPFLAKLFENFRGE